MPTNWIIDIDAQGGEREFRRAMEIIANSVLTYQERDHIATVATRAASRVVLNEAKRRAPTRTGKLRSAIRIEDRRSRHSQGLGRTAVGRSIVTVDAKRAPYWPFVEYGHRIVRNKKIFGRVPARPFLRPALERTRGQQFREAARAATSEFRRLKANQPDRTLLLAGPDQTQQAALPAPSAVLFLPPPR